MTKVEQKWVDYLRSNFKTKSEAIKYGKLDNMHNYYPNIFILAFPIGRKAQSYIKMLKLMPNYVKFKSGQEWKGTSVRHKFICNKYGEFEALPQTLMNSTWKRGLSGHISDANASIARKNGIKIVCSNGEDILPLERLVDN